MKTNNIKSFGFRGKTSPFRRWMGLASIFLALAALSCGEDSLLYTLPDDTDLSGSYFLSKLLYTRDGKTVGSLDSPNVAGVLQITMRTYHSDKILFNQRTVEDGRVYVSNNEITLMRTNEYTGISGIYDFEKSAIVLSYTTEDEFLFTETWQRVEPFNP